MVLLKGFDERGFVFYTNFESAKGQGIADRRQGCHVFSLEIAAPSGPHPWRRWSKSPARKRRTNITSSRPRGSRIGAWASKQSRPLESRFALEKEVARFTAKFGVGDIPRPEHWSGMRLVPTSIEFWHDRPFRLHDRIVFSRSAADQPWEKDRLYP